MITYTGANEHTGAERPPAVPLGELLDALDADRLDRTAGARARLVASTRCSRSTRATWSPASCAGARPFSFDRAALAGAEAARRPARRDHDPAHRAAAGAAAQDVALADLQAFLAHPVRASCGHRLDVDRAARGRGDRSTRSR